MAKNKKRNRNQQRPAPQSRSHQAPVSTTETNASVRQDAAPLANDAPAADVQTIAQQRAKHALDKINGYASRDGDVQKRFGSYVSSLGPMILMNGFGQAAAFYLANKKGEHRDVLDMLDAWLTGEGKPLHGVTGNHLVDRIVKLDVHRYRLAQAEALAYLDWLKKFTKAFLMSEADETEEKNEPATV